MTDRRPTVSVVIPVFNSGAMACGAIDSVLAQGRPDIEVVVVDDGSRDRSAEEIEAHIASRPGHVIRLVRQANGGAASARNAGIANCRGEFVAFLDSDDRWLPGKLDAQLAVFAEEPGVALVGSLTNTSASAFHRLHGDAPTYRVDYRAQLLSNRFQTSTVMIRASALAAVGGFPDSQRYAEEGDLFLRLVHRYGAVVVNRVLVDYDSGKAGFGQSGLSGNLMGMWKGELANLGRARKRGEIGWTTLGLMLAYSFAKFTRRVAIVRFRGRGGMSAAA